MGATQAPEATMATTVMVVVTVTVTEANSDGPSSVPGTAQPPVLPTPCSQSDWEARLRIVPLSYLETLRHRGV